MHLHVAVGDRPTASDANILAHEGFDAHVLPASRLRAASITMQRAGSLGLQIRKKAWSN
jgi:hypothetical protein